MNRLQFVPEVRRGREWTELKESRIQLQVFKKNK